MMQMDGEMLFWIRNDDGDSGFCSNVDAEAVKNGSGYKIGEK